jgi:hypothetical protein
MADTKVELIMLAQHNENDDLDVVVERANNIELKLSTTELANAGVQGIATQESGSYSICGEVPSSFPCSNAFE